MVKDDDKFAARKKARRRTLSATEAAGVISGPQVSGRVGQLMKLLNNCDPLIREGAVKSMTRIGGKHAEAGLIASLDDADPRVRAAVYKGLGRLRVFEAIDNLVEGLEDEDEAARCAAAAGLGQLGDYRGLGLVMQCLHTNNKLCWEAMRCLNLMVKKQFPANPQGLEEALQWVSKNRKKFKARKSSPKPVHTG